MDVYAPDVDVEAWSVTGVSSWSIGEIRSDGVVRLHVMPTRNSDEVRVKLEDAVLRWPVASAPEIPLTVRTGAVQNDGTVVLRVSTPGGVVPSQLGWVFGEGRLVDTTVRDGEVVARIQLEDSPYPRVVPVGVYRDGYDEGVAWTGK